MFALTIQTVYLVMMMIMTMIQVIFKHLIWKLQMMKLLKYSETRNMIECHHVSCIFWNLIVYTFISLSCNGNFFHKCFCILIVIKLSWFIDKFNVIIYIIKIIENIRWFPLSVYNMCSLGYIYMCTDTPYFIINNYFLLECIK